jgi:hypothetical protein
LSFMGLNATLLRGFVLGVTLGVILGVSWWQVS